LTPLLAVVILWEYIFFWTPDGSLPNLPTTSGQVAADVMMLAERRDIRAVFDIPWEHFLTDKEAMFLQTGHQKPLLAGHIARATPVDLARLTLLQQTLDPALLDAAGVDMVILHKEFDDPEGITEAFVRSRLTHLLYEDEKIAVFEAPATNASPTFIVGPLVDASLSEQRNVYLYAPEPGWTLVTGILRADDRQVELRLNHEPIHRWVVNGEDQIKVPVYLSRPGYATLSLAVEPPCVRIDNPVVKCRTVEVADLAIGAMQGVSEMNPIRFENGIILEGSRVNREGYRVSVWLNWRFDQPRAATDVRFVHVVDSAGELMGQADESLGIQPTGSWSEAVKIDLSGNLPLGEYAVYIGWYAFPDVRPFYLLDDEGTIADGNLKIATFEISP
jgi:hypothetical protein